MIFNLFSTGDRVTFHCRAGLESADLPAVPARRAGMGLPRDIFIGTTRVSGEKNLLANWPSITK
jgi:hypothetical protein